MDCLVWLLQIVRVVNTMKSLPIAIRLLALLALAWVATPFASNVNFLSDTTAGDLTEDDRQLQLAAVSAVLDAESATSEQQWNNPQTGNSGSIRSLGNLRSEDGLHCRKIKISTLAKGRENQSTFPVCKDAEGGWFLASGKKLTSAK